MSAVLRPGACLLTLLLPLTVAAGPDPDTVRVWCFGGRTGAAHGNSITRDGELAQFAKPLRSDTVSTFLRKDPGAADSVFAALDRIDFRTLRQKGRAIMTCVLELRDSAGKHSVSWPAGSPPRELEPAIAALRSAFGERGWP